MTKDEALSRLIQASRDLVDAVSFDDCGIMLGGKYHGGNGGLLSRGTISKADACRRAIVAAKEVPSNQDEEQN